MMVPTVFSLEITAVAHVLPQGDHTVERAGGLVFSECDTSREFPYVTMEMVRL